MKAAFVSTLRQSFRWFAWLALFLVVAIQTACATGPRLVNHSFQFDPVWDSPGIEVLDYRYGQSKNPVARGCLTPSCDKSRQGGSTSGTMLVGDDLYVKWRIKSTGEVYEDTVDLKSRLPDNIANHRINVIVDGSQLYVYLIVPKRKDGCPDNYTQEALACIREAVARNGGVAVGCPPRKEILCRITEPCPSADLRIISGYCSKEIIRIYPGQPMPLNIEFK